jgi:hypothetical protein
MSDSLLGGDNPPVDNTPPVDNPPVDDNTGGGPDFNLPENWKELAGFKDDPALEPIKDFKGLVSSMVNAQRMIGADKIQLPNKHDDGSQLREIFHKLGLPSEADKYEIKAEIEEGSEGLLNAFKEKAYELGVLPGQAQDLFQHMYKTYNETDNQAFEEFNKQRIHEQEALKKEWGQGYDGKIQLATNAIKHLAGEDQNLFDHLVSAEVGGDPKMVKMFAKIGEMLKEDNIISDAQGKWGKTPEEAQAEIESIMGDSKHPYNDGTHPSHARAVQEVLKLREMTLAN